MYKLEKTSILDKDNLYKTVISISPFPKKNELISITKRFTNNRKLSIFKSDHNSCLNLILNPSDKCEYININNVEYLISYLTENNIKINYQLTKIMRNSNPDLLFYIS